VNGDTPKRIQRKRTKGWRMPEGARSVTRPGPFGNPFVVGDDATCEEHAAGLFRNWLETGDGGSLDPYGSAEYRQRMSARRDWILDRASDLRGLDLACYCPEGQPCHADVLLEIANGGEAR
jgi:hypothetical protein